MSRRTAASSQLSLEFDSDNRNSALGVEYSGLVDNNTSIDKVAESNRQLASDPVFAQTARQAGRRNAARISESEENALRDERRRLLEKKFDGGLTRKEANRLQYVRWSIDRIDDAREGLALDALDAAVQRYEALGDEIDSLVRQITNATRRK